MTLVSHMHVRTVTTIFWFRMRILSRYRGWLLLDMVVPTAIAAIPILMGRALGGINTAATFLENTGTANYVAYMVIGANIFMIVSNSLWIFGFWLRNEMQTGTLESLYLSPVSKLELLGGISLYAAVRSLVAFGVAFSTGCFIFGVNPFQGDIVLAVLFLIIGLIPIYGISFFYGAVIIRLKEANSLINVAQWVIAAIMGIYYPVAVLPRVLRFLCMLFPPTWVNQDIRASLLGVSYFFGEWYFDLAVLWVFCVAAPLIGYYTFLATERKIKKNEGVGKF
jgi:ABC-2 type transport system permease protein